MKKLAYLVLLGVVATALVPMAIARPGYRTTLIAQYDLPADKDGVRTIGCNYCHVSPNGGTPWNDFGNALRANFKGNIGDALYETLKAMKDSDGDGYADVLEVFAKTSPSDKASKPSATVDALKADLDKAGGVDKFKPKP